MIAILMPTPLKTKKTSCFWPLPDNRKGFFDKRLLKNNNYVVKKCYHSVLKNSTLGQIKIFAAFCQRI